jgi:thiamine-phosphate pyrophosphorylase
MIPSSAEAIGAGERELGMDRRLVAWARAVKARRRQRAGELPTLWLFTDAHRVPDPLPAIRLLPHGSCGVVFRHDGMPGRVALAPAVSRLCRARGLALSVAGDARLALRLHAGVHLRAGDGLIRQQRHHRFATASAHGIAEVYQARRRGATAVFASPVFPTQSHAGAKGLGVIRFASLCRLHPCVMALGGVDGTSARRLPRCCAGAGAITALETPI